MMENESDQDNWQPSPAINNQYSMFEKIVVNFTNDDIDRNVEQQLSHPHYFNDDDIDPDDRPQQPQKYQSLYNPLQDDENQNWLRKLHTNSKKPLICPNCFTQLAYTYKTLPNNEYLCQKPTNLQVLETKVIRNRTCPQTMDLTATADTQKMLLQREEEINVKIVCTCQCGVDIGYYDVNKCAYVLVNVV